MELLLSRVSWKKLLPLKIFTCEFVVLFVYPVKQETIVDNYETLKSVVAPVPILK